MSRNNNYNNHHPGRRVRLRNSGDNNSNSSHMVQPLEFDLVDADADADADADYDDDDIRAGPIRNESSSSAVGRCATGCVSVTTTTVNICHPICTILLAVMVILLGLQVRTLQQQVVADEIAVETLQEQFAADHATQQDLDQRVQKEHSLTLYQMAGTFTLLTCLITTFHITQHLSNLHEAVVQRKIIAILWMSPIYSVTSFLSLVFPVADEYLAVIKDLYEAYVIYTFLSFLIAVLGRGNRSTAVSVLACHANHLAEPTKCLRRFYHPPPETDNTAKASAVLMECQILAMQFVLARPVTSLAQFVAEMVPPQAMNEQQQQEELQDDPWSYFKTADFYIAMVVNVSVFFAFNGLLKFYHAVQEDLQWCRPFPKFLAIKGIVFLTFWQGLLIEILVNVYSSSSSSSATDNHMSWADNTTAPMSHYTAVPTPSPFGTFSPAMGPVTLAPTSFEGATIDVTDTGNLTRQLLLLHRFLQQAVDQNDNYNNYNTSETQSARIQNFLICLEMLFFSLAHYCVFPVEEWAPDYRPQSVYAKPGFGLKDFASDLSYIVTSSSQARQYRRFQDKNNHNITGVLPTSSSLSLEEENVDDNGDESARSTDRELNDLNGENQDDKDVVMVLSEAHAIEEGGVIPGLPDNFSYRDNEDDDKDDYDPRTLT